MKKILTLPNLNLATHWMNRQLDTAYLAGKPLLIHFWSISCGHCKEAMPTLQTIRDRYADQIRTIAVHMPLSQADTDVQEVAAVSRTYQINEPLLIDNDHRLADAFSNRYVPAYYLFASDHTLYEYHLGQRGADRIGRAAERMLNQSFT
ncbi:MAG: TlpA disulfide reductase family protein [Sporolactobacillus sp.]